MAVGQKSWLAAQGIDTYDAIQTIIQWQHDSGRFTSTHLTHWVDPNSTTAMSDQSIKVIGTRGRIECDQKHRGVQVVSDERGVEDVNPYFSAFFDDSPHGKRFEGYGYQSVRSFLRDVDFVRCGQLNASQLDDVRPSFRDAFVSTAIVEANRASLQQNGQWVDVRSA
jgi:D-galacturonate reductase